MAGVLTSRTLSVSITCDPRSVYAFVSNPENLPKWAKMFCRSIKPSNGEWVVETPQGPVKLQFATRNDLGVLDHTVTVSSGVEVFVPMRVVPNGAGSEVLFTLFQTPAMSDASFAEDLRLVEQDLTTLKQVLEAMARGG